MYEYQNPRELMYKGKTFKYEKKPGGRYDQLKCCQEDTAAHRIKNKNPQPEDA